jgi:hypothetical protein
MASSPRHDPPLTAGAHPKRVCTSQRPIGWVSRLFHVMALLDDKNDHAPPPGGVVIFEPTSALYPWPIIITTSSFAAWLETKRAVHMQWTPK